MLTNPASTAPVTIPPPAAPATPAVMAAETKVKTEADHQAIDLKAQEKERAAIHTKTEEAAAAQRAADAKNAELEKAKAAIKDKVAEIAKLQAEADRMALACNGLTAEALQAAKDVEARNAELSKLKSEAEANAKTRAKNQAERLNAAVANLRKDITTQEGKIGSLTSGLTLKSAELKGLQTAAEKLATEVTQLETDANAKAEAVSQCRAAKKEAEDQQAKIEADLAVAKPSEPAPPTGWFGFLSSAPATPLETAKAKVKECTTRLGEAANISIAAANLLNGAKEKATKLQLEIAGKDIEVKKVQEEIAAVQTAAKATQSNVDMLTAKISELLAFAKEPESEGYFASWWNGSGKKPAEAARPAEAAAKPAEAAAKPAEPAVTPAETAAKPPEAAAKPVETVAAKAPEAAAKPAAPVVTSYAAVVAAAAAAPAPIPATANAAGRRPTPPKAK